MYCKKCGKELVEGTKFCKYCGAKREYDDPIIDKNDTYKAGSIETQQEKKNNRNAFIVVGIAIVIVLLVVIFDCYSYKWEGFRICIARTVVEN